MAAVLGFGLLAGTAYAGYWYGTESAKFKTPVVAVKHDGKIFELGYLALAHSETHTKYIGVFDQALPTFEFLD